MGILDNREVRSFIDMCHDAWQKGWNESSGGNASHLIEDVSEIYGEFNYLAPWEELGFSATNLKDCHFIITGSGRCFRNVNKYPEENIAIIKIDSTGTKFQKVWGLILGGKTTMETPTHLLAHNIKVKEGNKTILHCHSPNINALTFTYDLDKNVFTKEIWEMITECVVMFPKGIAVLEWMVCGSLEIGERTCALMEDNDVVVWAHHGTFCSGKDCDNAFGLMETLEKASDILIKVNSMGGKKQSITKDNFKEVAEYFGYKHYELK